DLKEAGGRIDLPIDDVAARDQIPLGPDSRNAVPEQRVEIEVALDHGVFHVVADDAAVPVVVVKREVALQLQAPGDFSDGQFFEWRIRHSYLVCGWWSRGIGGRFARGGSKPIPLKRA